MSTASLMAILKFTDEDLSYNRRGEFSLRQIAKEQVNAQGWGWGTMHSDRYPLAELNRRDRLKRYIFS
jgi:hypothetical protein